VSTLLLGVALVAALLTVPAVSMSALGLAGGDGTPDNAVLGICGGLLGWGSLYNAAVTFAAFFGDLQVRWWLMWLAPLGGLVGVALSARQLRGDRPLAVAGAFALPSLSALAPFLVLAAGSVEL
jgi:hypothetical protein